MKKIVLTASAVILGVACFSSLKVQSFADCDGECEVPSGPGGSAYTFVPLPGYSAPAGGTTESTGVVKKGRMIGNNEFGFGGDNQDQQTDSEEEVIDPAELPAE